MDYKKSTRLLEELLDAKVSIEGEDVVLLRGGEEVRAKYGYAPLALAIFMPKEKAWAALKALYGEEPERAYREYLRIPMRACWLSRAVAKAIAMRLAGKGTENLDDEVARRWPNVCGEVNAFSEAMKLVTKMNELGMTAAFYQEEKEGEVRTAYGSLRVKKSSPEDARFMKELRALLEEDKELFEEVMEILGESKGCFDLAKAVDLVEEKLPKYGMVRAKIRERAAELARDILYKVKREGL